METGASFSHGSQSQFKGHFGAYFGRQNEALGLPWWSKVLPDRILKTCFILRSPKREGVKGGEGQGQGFGASWLAPGRDQFPVHILLWPLPRQRQIE